MGGQGQREEVDKCPFATHSPGPLLSFQPLQCGIQPAAAIPALAAAAFARPAAAKPLPTTTKALPAATQPLPALAADAAPQALIAARGTHSGASPRSRSRGGCASSCSPGSQQFCCPGGQRSN